MRSTYKAFTLDEAKRRMEHYCAYQERCHKEVREKLRRMRMIPDAIDLVVTHLIQHDYLNEERFSRLFARSKFRQKSWGRIRIERELQARDITAFNIRAAMEEIPAESYESVLDELARKKLESLNSQPLLRKKKKLLDFLMYRGWESHLVYRKIEELLG